MSRSRAYGVYSPRPWEFVQEPGCGSPTGEKYHFSVMSYNVLSPALQWEHPYLYTDCDQRALVWNYRWTCFTWEIDFYRPDIVCLQEVDADLKQEFDKFFKSIDYNGVHKQRTGDKRDGCAIYFSNFKFKLLEFVPVEYYSRGTPLLDRDNVALLVKLETKTKIPEKLVVATTHLLYNPKRMDIKVAQSMLLLAELDRMAWYGEENGRPLYHPCIVTGDFNSQPMTVVAKLFSEGKVSLSMLGDRSKEHLLIKARSSIGISPECQYRGLVQERRQLLSESTVNDSDTINNSQIHSTNSADSMSENRISHFFNFLDAYHSGVSGSNMNINATYPDHATTHQNDWACVDYIFCSSKSEEQQKCEKQTKIVSAELKVHRRVKLPTKDECRNFGRIPSEGVSSDHFPLMAEFVLTPYSKIEIPANQIDEFVT